METNYQLLNVIEEDKQFVAEVNITNIFDYAKNISCEEIEDILSYVDCYVIKFLKDYKIIVKDGKSVAYY